MLKVRRIAVGLATLGFVAAACNPAPQTIQMNEVQYLGSHNSYHIAPSDPFDDALVIATAAFPTGEDPAELRYNHSPLPVQFSDEGVRQIELDVFLDPDGRYQVPTLPEFFCNTPSLATTLLGQSDCTGLDMPGYPSYGADMAAPGIKVLHIQDIDFRSTCPTLIGCLEQVRDWSDAHPLHLPISILIENKQGQLIDPADVPLPGLTFTEGPAWDGTGLDELDAEIRSVFAPGRMITPDDVRGTHATLEAAVLADDWPTLDEARGKVMFLMNNAGSLRTAYRVGAPSLEGRVMFTNSSPGSADAAFVMRNTPTDSSIPGLVAQGYMVRTRADTPNVQALSGDTSRRDAAFASGAQFVSTDYQVEGRAAALDGGSDYFVEMPGPGIARCNPVSAAADCVDVGLYYG